LHKNVFEGGIRTVSKVEELGEPAEASPEQDMADLKKSIVLHLKRYDTAPLNCTVLCMANKLGKPADEVYAALRELLSDEVVGPWVEWTKGAVTPYKLLSLPKLIDGGINFTYDEIELLTGPQGGSPQDKAISVVSGVGGSGRTYIVSTWAKDNLKEISRKIGQMGLADRLKPERPKGKGFQEGLSYDTELGYLNTFFRSLFWQDEAEPLYVLYSSENEDLPAFRRRTLNRTLQAMSRMSSTLLERIEQGRTPPAAYVFFFASMVKRYVSLSEEVGVPPKETRELLDLREKILAKVGEAR